MKRKLSFPFIVFLTLILNLYSCSKTEKTEYTNAIPANATGLAAIDMKAIVEKAGLNSAGNQDFQKKFLGLLLEGSTPTLGTQIEKLLKNPAETGIDWETPVYVFNAPSLHSMTAALKVNDLKKLESLIDMLAKENICTIPTKADKYSTTEIKDAGIQLAFNDGTLLAIYAQSTTQLKKLSAAIAMLMKQPADKSIHTNEHFDSMMKQRGDIRLLATPEVLPFDMRGVLNWPQNTRLTGSVLFENGKIYANLQRAGFNGETKESNQPFHPQSNQELLQAMMQMMQGKPFNIELTSNELLTLTNLHAIMEFEPDNTEVNTLYGLIMKIETLNARGDNNRTTFTVTLKEKGQNSLKQLVDFARQFIGL
ncbi:DUF4836 family protein [Bacteroides helcogenes]|uniref:DUF4836 family protein n=1 Tax=Bacteroides helcogenes (strain ATCC 35417 / DSM 20613 / JCM 6297 / CCUG 15421 / P 36-108) TaxID=693979 RepID=E6SVP5_BACT6|nr:DUF4836 family protein [Bacteroides helcogenes]ADV43506.1 hypothetical protein Bache_1501 [Bacteroides helcogenes P 36-108]MDY5239232.1 DUF4836 family protein [Bacteroides helcogenes]